VIISPDVTGWTEAGLEILQHAGLSPGQAAKVFRPLFVCTFGHAAFAPREDMQDVAEGRAQWCSASRQTVYPLVTAAARELR
jgi:hypothetical protein